MITTFLHDSELNRPTSDKEINYLIGAIRELSADNWQVVEREQRIDPPFLKIWRSYKIVKYYEIYKYVGGCGPWQQINFYPGPDASSSINASGNATTVSSFLYGLLAGIHDKRKIHAPSIEDCTDC